MTNLARWILLNFLILFMCFTIGCGKRVIVIPDDKELRPVYTAAGKKVEDRYSISKGWLLEIMMDLEGCGK